MRRLNRYRQEVSTKKINPKDQLQTPMRFRQLYQNELYLHPSFLRFRDSEKSNPSLQVRELTRSRTVFPNWRICVDWMAILDFISVAGIEHTNTNYDLHVSGHLSLFYVRSDS
ncbi:hypothetical protein P879_03445 [Paragonimus westermani]|uniref:Uncharacterized protein n=1 Tax=Paragonimus westermani TaxID=34504 RepID=A0A8T0DLA7_9TREM|nr:hypothetical protein P879_03445 [Paragonimus westermani]